MLPFFTLIFPSCGSGKFGMSFARMHCAWFTPRSAAAPDFADFADFAPEEPEPEPPEPPHPAVTRVRAAAEGGQ